MQKYYWVRRHSHQLRVDRDSVPPRADQPRNPEPASTSPLELRVFFDNGHRWPLWEAGNKPNMDSTGSGFSLELTQLLQNWHHVWAPIAGFEIGQSVPEPLADAYAREAELSRAAVARIRREVPAGVIVDTSLIGV